MFWKLQENILEKEDREELAEFVRTTERFTQFVKVREFENAWSSWQGCRYSVFVNSGSSANLIMLAMMKQRYGWSDGDEVIVPAVTWVTNIAPVMQCGLKPVFVDVNLEDLSFDYDHLLSSITDRTRAIFITHIIGLPADMDRIRAAVGDRPIELMEDCCESHGANIRGVKVGNMSACSSFSFYWGHHMTTVEGGVVCTDDEELYRSAILKRSHGLARELPERYHAAYREQYPDIDFNFLFLTDGFNFRNTELHAVLGLAQIKKLDSYISIRERNYRRFREIMAPFADRVRVPYREGMSPFCLPFFFNDAADRDRCQKFLREAGVESRPVISGNLLRQPFLKGYGDYRQFPHAEFLHTNGFYIGNNQFVDDQRLGILSDLIRKFFAV